MNSSNGTASQPRNPKALRILARSLFKELKQNGYDSGQIVSFSSELIGLVSADLSADHVHRPTAG